MPRHEATALDPELRSPPTSTWPRILLY